MENKQIIKKWEKYFKNRGLDKSIQDSYLKYISKLLDNSLPIIFESEHLSKLLGRQESYLFSIVYASSKHYRSFKIKKKRGGFRTIDSPYPTLLECQKWIQKQILNKIKIHSSAHGFANKKSIVTNAKIHIDQNQLLKIDLKDFFPSIKKGRVIAMFCDIGYPPEVSFLLASICCLKDCLPQGAPTSPMISNVIASNLDNRIMALCKYYNYRYTRYADDITISGEKIPTRFIEYVYDIIRTESFEINNRKTVLYRGKGKRIVTGVSISSTTIKAPKLYKRTLFQKLYYIEKHGIKSHMTKLKIKNPFYVISMIGQLNYILNIEPDNKKAKLYKSMLQRIESSQNQNTVID